MNSILLNSRELAFAHVLYVDRSVTFAVRRADFQTAAGWLERDDKHKFSSCLPGHTGFLGEGLGNE